MRPEARYLTVRVSGLFEGGEHLRSAADVEQNGLRAIEPLTQCSRMGVRHISSFPLLLSSMLKLFKCQGTSDKAVLGSVKLCEHRGNAHIHVEADFLFLHRHVRLLGWPGPFAEILSLGRSPCSRS